MTTFPYALLNILYSLQVFKIVNVLKIVISRLKALLKKKKVLFFLLLILQCVIVIMTDW